MRSPARDSEREECDGVRATLTRESSLGGGAGEVGNDDHPERLGRQHKHEIDAVRTEEAVRLRATAELVCEQGSCTCGREREHDLRETGEEAAPKRAPGADDAAERPCHRLPTLL